MLTGPNGCGKSTVLFACACACDVPGRGARDLTPGGLFPDFTSRQPVVASDAAQRTEIEFHYLHGGDRVSMVWKRGRSWKQLPEPQRGAPAGAARPDAWSGWPAASCSGATQARSPSPPCGRSRTHVPDVARIVGRREAERNAMPELLAGLKTLIDR